MKLQPINYWKYRSEGLIEFAGDPLSEAELEDIEDEIVFEIRVISSGLKGWGEFTHLVRLRDFLPNGEVWEESYYLATPDVVRRAA